MAEWGHREHEGHHHTHHHSPPSPPRHHSPPCHHSPPHHHLGHHPPPQHYPEHANLNAPHHVAASIAGDVVKIFARADPHFSLSARDNKVVLVPANNADIHQQWIKDERWGSKITDVKGFPAFALINRATGGALTHPVHASPETQIVLGEYDINRLDESHLWTRGSDIDHTWHALRPCNNIALNLDASHGVKDKKGGGIVDGTPAILFDWKDGHNQHWQFARIEHHNLNKGN